MTLKFAVERLVWRFGSGNSFSPDKTDIEALKHLIGYINDANERAVENNTGFAKLYIYAFFVMLEEYGEVDEKGKKIPASIFSDIPQKQLNKMLDQPISYFVKRFTKKLNESEKYVIMDKIITESKHPAMFTEKEKQEQFDKLKKLPEEERKKIFEDAWDEETVESNLMAMVSAALIKYKI